MNKIEFQVPYSIQRRYRISDLIGQLIQTNLAQSLRKTNNPIQYQMRKIFMINHQVRQPSLNIKVLTEFDILGHFEPPEDTKIAKIYVYTAANVYMGDLIKSNVNKQLAWNEHSITTMKDSLSGKRCNVQIKFTQTNLKFSLICEVETGINIELFWIQLQEMENITPINHMKIIFMQYRVSYAQQEANAKAEKERINAEIKEVHALEEQIKEQTITQIAHIKKNFIEVINNCKKQLRKYMKTGISQIVNEDQEVVEEENEFNRRKFMRINRTALENKGEEMEDQADERDNVNFESVFD